MPNINSLIPKKFYFVRHGVTDWNIAQKIQGHTDIELNESGRQQAYQLGQFLKKFSFSAIYSSPLKRALETAQIIQKSHPSDKFPIQL